MACPKGRRRGDTRPNTILSPWQPHAPSHRLTDLHELRESAPAAGRVTARPARVAGHAVATCSPGRVRPVLTAQAPVFIQVYVRRLCGTLSLGRAGGRFPRAEVSAANSRTCRSPLDDSLPSSRSVGLMESPARTWIDQLPSVTTRPSVYTGVALSTGLLVRTIVWLLRAPARVIEPRRADMAHQFSTGLAHCRLRGLVYLRRSFICSNRPVIRPISWNLVKVVSAKSYTVV